MKKYLIAILLIVPGVLAVSPVTPAQVVAQSDTAGIDVPVAKANRIYNKTGIQCVYCSLETLSRHHKIVRGYDFTDKYKSFSCPEFVEIVCKERNIPVRQVRDRVAGVVFLKKYVRDDKLGCGVGLNGVHCVTIVHWDEGKKLVGMIDNMGPKALEVQIVPMDAFKAAFDGWAFAVIPDNRAKDQKLSWMVLVRPLGVPSI